MRFCSFVFFAIATFFLGEIAQATMAPYAALSGGTGELEIVHLVTLGGPVFFGVFALGALIGAAPGDPRPE